VISENKIDESLDFRVYPRTNIYVVIVAFLVVTMAMQVSCLLL
jgi:hypothetical protein